MSIVLPLSRDEPVEDYLERINESNLSVVEFLQTLISINPIDENDTAFKKEFIDIAKSYDIKSEETAARYSFEIIHKKILPEFMVTQKRDLSSVNLEVLVALVNLIDDGLSVEKQEDMGYGLKAKKDKVGFMLGQPIYTSITIYGGVKQSQDYNLSLVRPYELRQYGSRYVVGLQLDNEEKIPGEDWVIDGELFFKLSEKGRWANTSLEDDGNNAQFLIDTRIEEFDDVTEVHPSQRIVRVVLVKNVNIEVNPWIYVDYMGGYPEEFLGGESPPKKKTKPRVESCVECDLTALFKCKCHIKSYCSQRCANKDHSFN